MPLALSGPVGNGVPATYVMCTDPPYPMLDASRRWVRDAGWPVRELAAGHDAMVTAPGPLAAMLDEMARETPARPLRREFGRHRKRRCLPDRPPAAPAQADRG